MAELTNAMAGRNTQEIYRAAARLREQQFKKEELGSIGKFYEETAKGYEKRMEEASAEYQYWADIWEDRFKRAEQAYAEWQAQGSKPVGPMKPKVISAYAEGKPWSNDKVIGLSILLNEKGERRTMEEITKLATSKTGNQRLSAIEAQNYLVGKIDLDEASKTYERYSTRYQEELAALDKRNEEARQRFLEDKQRQLAAAEGMTAYRGPTYQEKPL